MNVRELPFYNRTIAIRTFCKCLYKGIFLVVDDDLIRDKTSDNDLGSCISDLLLALF
jgi:hypothetical protein